MKIRKGMLVYVPSGVRLFKPVKDAAAYEIYVEDYVTTEKPSNCLVLESQKDATQRSFSILYEGQTWQVPANSVYHINEGDMNVSYIS